MSYSQIATDIITRAKAGAAEAAAQDGVTCDDDAIRGWVFSLLENDPRLSGDDLWDDVIDELAARGFDYFA